MQQETFSIYVYIGSTSPAGIESMRQSLTPAFICCGYMWMKYDEP